MDLSRVFGGDQPAAQGAWGAPTQAPQSGAPAAAPVSQNSSYQGDEAQAFNDAYKAATTMQEAVANLQQQVAHMNAAAEATRQSYSQLCAERDGLRTQVQTAARRLGEVQRVVSRYAVVEDPVVASDGYTYEKKVIESYLSDCRQSKSEAISQQTKEVLSDTLLPNQSLRKLVDLLKTVKPEMLGTIPKGGDEAPQRPAKGGDDADEGEPRTQPAGDGRLHPCVRVYGFCNYKESCTYANYPYDACLSHLKGKCRFGSQCHEYHVDLKRPVAPNQGTPNRGPRPAKPQQSQPPAPAQAPAQ